MPQSDRLFKSGYSTHKDHWIGWLEEYDGPGYYGRSNWKRDARFVYQHLNSGPMLVWLCEAADENPVLISRAIREMRRSGPRAQTEAMVVRQPLPWERAARLVFGSRSYSIQELLRTVRRLHATMPEFSCGKATPLWSDGWIASAATTKMLATQSGSSCGVA
jgi:hypothetical protein